MNKLLRILTVECLVLLATVSVIAQDSIYVVGNFTEWKEPIESNAEFYRNFRLKPDGEKDGNTIWRGDFDISNLGECPVFRFYTQLNGWEISSLGSQEIDEPIKFTLSEIEYGIPLVDGKGSFNIPDWDGDHIYITLWGNKMSASPKDYILPVPEPSFTCSDHNLRMVNSGNSGCYYIELPLLEINYDANYTERGSINLSGALIGQPDKENVYINVSSPLIVDEYGIAQSDFTYSDTPAEFTFSNSADSWNGPILYIDTNNRKIYLNRNSSKWVWVNDQVPEITFDNYKNYDYCHINDRFGSIIIEDIPKGPLHVYYTTPSLFNIINYNASYWYVQVEGNTHVNSMIPDKTVYISPDWTGGSLIASSREMGYIESLNKMYVGYCNTDTHTFTPLTMNNDNPNIFEATIEVPATDMDKEFINAVRIVFSDKPDYSGPSLRPQSVIYQPGFIFSEVGKPIIDNYNYNPYEIGINVDQYLDGGKIKIAVNVETKTMEITPLSENLQNIPFYKSVVDGEKYAEYRLLRLDRNKFASYANTYLENIEWTFFMSDGKNLIIDFSKPIKDEDGVKSYKYTLSSSDPSTQLPITTEKLLCPKINIINIDVENNVIELYDSQNSFSDYTYDDGLAVPKFLYVWPKLSSWNHNYENIFVETKGYVGLQKYLKSPRLQLVKADTDEQIYIYEGGFTIPQKPLNNNDIYEFDEIEIHIGAIPYYDYDCRPYYGVNLGYNWYEPFDNPIFEISTGFGLFPTPCVIDKFLASNEYAVRVILEKDGFTTVWIGSGDAGILNVEETEEDLFNVSSEMGALRIVSSTQRHLDIFSISGCLVKSLDINQGITFINGMAKGIYIVNGKKIII